MLIVRRSIIGFISILAASIGCGGSPSSPSPTTTATSTTASTPTTTSAPQVLTDTRLTAIISRSSELSFRAINAALDRAALSVGLSARTLAFSDVTLKSTIERERFACPGGGSATFDIFASGVMGTRDDNIQLGETQTFLNCSITFDDGQTVTVTGTLTGTGSYGKTPSGQQSFRRTGSFTYFLEPSNVTGQCTADLSINYLTLKDPRARANGTACGRAIDILLPVTTPAFPDPTLQTPPPPVAGAAPRTGAYTGSYSITPGRCGTYNDARWKAVFRIDGGNADVTFTSEFQEGQVQTLRVGISGSRQIQFGISTEFGKATFDGTFSDDWNRVEGTWVGSPCIPNDPLYPLGGKWSGARQ